MKEKNKKHILDFQNNSSETITLITEPTANSYRLRPRDKLTLLVPVEELDMEPVIDRIDYGNRNIILWTRCVDPIVLINGIIENP